MSAQGLQTTGGFYAELVTDITPLNSEIILKVELAGKPCWYKFNKNAFSVPGIKVVPVVEMEEFEGLNYI